MSFEGGEMVFGRRGLGVTLAVLAAAMLIVAGLFASPARAQAAEDIVVDFSVDVEQGECGEGDCADDERPVTFEPELSVNEDEGRELTAEQLDDVNQILEDDADVEITVVDSEGNEETVAAGEPVCLEPGEYDFIATVVNEDELAAAIGNAIGDDAFIAEDLVIEDFEDTFTVEECDDGDDDDNGNVDIDDRDQTNVCNNVVNIILENVQNPDVDSIQYVDSEATNYNYQYVNGQYVTVGDSDNDQTVTVDADQITEIAQQLDISVQDIVQQCFQQNAGRDNNNDSNDDNNNDDDNDNNNDDGDDNNAADQDDVDGEVIVDTIPDGLLPNTGGISPFVILAGLGSALMVAGFSVSYAVGRRRL